MHPFDPFDPAAAAGQVRWLPMVSVVDLLSVTHAPDRIQSYRDAMLRGDRFPPVSVVRIGRRFVVADGHKRFSAYATLGRPDILVEVWTLRRLLQDQARQAAANLRKNLRIASRSVTDPAEAWRLLMTTTSHWKRVAVSLATRLPSTRSRSGYLP